MQRVPINVVSLQFTIPDLMVDDIDNGDFEMQIHPDKAKSGAAGAQAKTLIETVSCIPCQ